ncbi:MAG TPA: ParB/RepB/Spo0J family partition protein [Stellaceae bacterium]|nr:ParB/RepB/Spo0J family partition protein [Stellaceae bacterium]
MTAPAAQWQLDRLSTNAREAAEIASLGAGVSLSSWLTKLISETCSAEGVAPPAEPPKILEFTREIRDRVPSTPRIQPAPTPMPANTSLPPLQQPMQPSAPAIESAAAAAFPPPMQPAAPPQQAAAPVQPTVFRPTPVPTATPMPAPTPLVAPVSAYRPQPVPPAPIQQAPVQQPMQPVQPVQPIPVQQMPVQPPQAAPVVSAPVPPAPVAPAPFTAPPSFAQPAPVAVPPVAPPPVAAAPAPHPVPAGATMLPVAAMVVANLGTRRGDDMPETLVADIATRGVRQPVTVRRSASNPEQYEIICGHRRWRAAQRVGLAQIPAIVVTQDDATAILASLAENLQLNLSVVDEAQAYLRLLTQCAIDVSAVTAATGRDRKHIVQSMRLLGLPPLVRHLIGSGMLSREHAFVLLDAPQPEALADAILAEHLSVEAARQRIAAGAEGKP